jgi:sulfite reductase (NADPH) flavoprotein alpha-component
VARTIAAAGLQADEAVSVDGITRSLGQWLNRYREVTRVARALIERLSALTGDAGLAMLLKPESAATLRARFKEWQVPDLLAQYPAAWTGERLVRALHPISPRLYSISSAPEEVGDEVHVTVAVVDEIHDGNRHQGAVSSQLQLLEPGARFRAFIEPNTRFRLPADDATDVIMIGPGTGIAPFRGFVQSRTARGATGRQWLFFGGRHLDRDFLYQTEWLAALKKGALTRLDVAFSRDTAEKVYVQHRLREHGAELYQWLESGASVYVCGDAERMAPDVQAALVEIVAIHGGKTAQDAEAYVAALTAARRYLRDVY